MRCNFKLLCLPIIWLCNTTSSFLSFSLAHTQTLPNSKSISRHFFQLLASLHICILAMQGACTPTLSVSHTFSCTCWISDTQGAPYITSGCVGVPCERGWRGGRRAVCSAPLGCAKLVGWVTSRAEGEVEEGRRRVGGWRSWGMEAAPGSFPLTCREQWEKLTLTIICSICAV